MLVVVCWVVCVGVGDIGRGIGILMKMNLLSVTVMGALLRSNFMVDRR